MRNNLNYNYIFFNSKDNNIVRDNPNGYYTICVEDLIHMDGVHVVFSPLDHKNKLLRLLYGIYNSERTNRIIKLPFKFIWYPYYFKMPFNSDKPLCFVFLRRQQIYISYLKYLKRIYPNCRIILLHRDLLWVCNCINPSLLSNPIFDFEMSIDANEAANNNMVHFNEFESKIDVPRDKNYPLQDLFFAGRAKDRLPKLLKAYEIFNKQGLSCYYYLTGVKLEDRIELPGIVYAEKDMSYREMLYQTVNSRCVLEFNYGNAVGFTSRFLEAVMYNKRLITDNLTIIKNKFYNPDYIQCVSNAEDIDPSFVNLDSLVDFQYNDEFSPVHLIEQIDTELTSRYVC